MAGVAPTQGTPVPAAGGPFRGGTGGPNVARTLDLEEGEGYTPLPSETEAREGVDPQIGFRPWVPPGIGLDRQLELLVEERVRTALANITPDRDALREARIQADIYRQENERLTCRSPARTDGPSPSIHRNIQPREYSPRGNVGPSKWLYQMELYFEYARVPEDDRVRHAMILLKDAAEAWWRSHMMDTTDRHGAPTAERITSWKVSLL